MSACCAGVMDADAGEGEEYCLDSWALVRNLRRLMGAVSVGRGATFAFCRDAAM
ncbi:hypothetical protein E4U55_005456 [Claviceps digitariae]|nr:hypothetical protein E4U55_005456 [Claviceps digitariae]